MKILVFQWFLGLCGAYVEPICCPVLCSAQQHPPGPGLGPSPGLGPIWAHRAPYGPIGPLWAHMGPYGPILIGQQPT